MKKLMNDSEQIVEEFLQGFITVHGDSLTRINGTNVITRIDKVATKVGIISGGGSGHEPAHAGYVGPGMLDAAVAGEVFTSPGADQFLAAIQAADSGSGVLLVIKNYNGDVMNAEMAQEMAEAEGIQTEMIIVNDDVAVDDPAKRRGIAGTVLVHKITGAAAEAGKSLAEVKQLGEKAIQKMRSMSVALSACTLPSSSKPSFSLATDEMEVGIGIHGEQGMERREVMRSAEIAQLLTEHTLEELDENGSYVALINGMGSTPLLEQYVFAKDVQEQLEKRKVTLKKMYVGDYMTSLDMAGVSLTLLTVDDELLQLLHARAKTTTWTEAGNDD
ncbi:dihydroxyacetone kinase subunit DhaK [Geomicrobium sp. JCM 19039]|uniref:dihydroxyacetone kinase subunit DhaK n=1 Tax=Geomicrobium sp. JCM 19039 TaxID=1460636 RepID=UPI00045F237D|nr:dihydroxyacetone kinase subunit DhaK [Geomicrobium sp. JCM 19039]GAK10508.1 phosphoenolpyruvate-dihydroxyacetone phosphotransferase [Geomicrobium sp. JCM 19039]